MKDFEKMCRGFLAIMAVMVITIVMGGSSVLDQRRKTDNVYVPPGSGANSSNCSIWDTSHCRTSGAK